MKVLKTFIFSFCIIINCPVITSVTKPKTVQQQDEKKKKLRNDIVAKIRHLLKKVQSSTKLSKQELRYLVEAKVYLNHLIETQQ